MLSRGKFMSQAAILLVIGFIGLMNIMRNPRFAQFHNVDILQLIASGMCFGVALVFIVMAIRGLGKPQN